MVLVFSVSFFAFHSELADLLKEFIDLLYLGSVSGLQGHRFILAIAFLVGHHIWTTDQQKWHVDLTDRVDIFQALISTLIIGINDNKDLRYSFHVFPEHMRPYARMNLGCAVVITMRFLVVFKLRRFRQDQEIFGVLVVREPRASPPSLFGRKLNNFLLFLVVEIVVMVFSYISEKVIDNTWLDIFSEEFSLEREDFFCVIIRHLETPWDIIIYIIYITIINSLLFPIYWCLRFKFSSLYYLLLLN